MTVSLTVNEHAKVIQDLLRVGRPVNPAPPASSEPEDSEMRAVEEFFNDIRGCRFVIFEVNAEDVFMHLRVLNDCRLHQLIQSQKLLINVDDAGKGPQVQALRLLNE